MDVVKKMESCGSAPKGIVKQKVAIVDCGSCGESTPVGPQVDIPSGKDLFSFSK